MSHQATSGGAGASPARPDDTLLPAFEPTFRFCPFATAEEMATLRQRFDEARRTLGAPAFLTNRARLALLAGRVLEELESLHAARRHLAHLRLCAAAAESVGPGATTDALTVLFLALRAILRDADPTPDFSSPAAMRAGHFASANDPGAVETVEEMASILRDIIAAFQPGAQGGAPMRPFLEKLANWPHPYDLATLLDALPTNAMIAAAIDRSSFADALADAEDEAAQRQLTFDAMEATGARFFRKTSSALNLVRAPILSLLRAKADASPDDLPHGLFCLLILLEGWIEALRVPPKGYGRPLDTPPIAKLCFVGPLWGDLIRAMIAARLRPEAPSPDMLRRFAIHLTRQPRQKFAECPRADAVRRQLLHLVGSWIGDVTPSNRSLFQEQSELAPSWRGALAWAGELFATACSIEFLRHKDPDSPVILRFLADAAPLLLPHLELYAAQALDRAERAEAGVTEEVAFPAPLDGVRLDAAFARAPSEPVDDHGPEIETETGDEPAALAPLKPWFFCPNPNHPFTALATLDLHNPAALEAALREAHAEGVIKTSSVQSALAAFEHMSREQRAAHPREEIGGLKWTKLKRGKIRLLVFDDAERILMNAYQRKEYRAGLGGGDV